MAKKAENESDNNGGDFVTTGGAVIQGDVTVGKENNLTAREQGQVARGEVDENGKPKADNKVAEAEKKANAKASAAAVESGLTDKEKAVDAALVERRKVLEAAGETAGVKIVKTDAKLYVGKLTVSGTAGATGEPISIVYEQAEPTTEDGVFWAFRAYHPSALRDKTFKIDPENKDDPTLRTYKE